MQAGSEAGNERGMMEDGREGGSKRRMGEGWSKGRE